jgi:hypothetical protein
MTKLRFTPSSSPQVCRQCGETFETFISPLGVCVDHEEEEL